MRNDSQTSQGATTRCVMATLTFVCAPTACGGNYTYVTAPTAELKQRGPGLGLYTSVTIVFSESMDIASLQISGTLADESHGGIWSSTNAPNDTLTISPATGSWTGGATRTLIVDVRTVSGSPIPMISTTYHIDPLVLGNFQAAEVVTGQPDFITNGANQNGPAGANTFATKFGNPLVAPDGKLFVGEYINSRVLAFAQVPTVNNASASFVLGQPDFTSTNYSVSQSSNAGPHQVTMHNGKMIVVENDAHRVLIHNTTPDDGADLPDAVVGQPDFNSDSPDCDADSFRRPETVATTPDGKLLVTDHNNHRVLIWNSIPTTNFQPADLVLGQETFTRNTENDDTQDGVTDTPSARTLYYPSHGIHSNGPQPADVVLGQSNFSQRTNDDDQDSNPDGMPSARVFAAPYGVLFYRDRLAGQRSRQ